MKVEKIKVGRFDAMLIKHGSKNNMIQAKISLIRDGISQKLLFTLMEICHRHGFSCSKPYFDVDEDGDMIFLIGTFVQSIRSINGLVKRLEECLCDVEDFIVDFVGQMDFTEIDVSMFKDTDLSTFNPEHIVALRDQNFNGSWSDFQKQMEKEDRKEQIDFIGKCRSFEKINHKDIGLIGHKLLSLLELIEYKFESESEKN